MTDTFYHRPLGIISGTDAAQLIENEEALPLKGGASAFTQLEILKRSDENEISSRFVRAGNTRNLKNLIGEDAVHAITHKTPLPVKNISGTPEPVLMGILNVTPDSFSDGGLYTGIDTAVEKALAMEAAGAAIIDIGGESTRPGADPVSPEQELERVAPIIEACQKAGVSCLSIDTRNAVVMKEAVRLGAALINDVSALTHDPESIAVAREAGVPVILMHSQGTPRTMQQKPAYDDVLLDVYDYLRGRVEACISAGIPEDQLIIDPGIGFGKTVEHNLALLKCVGLFHGLGCPILVGASRKSFIAKLDRDEEASARLGGSLAALTFALQQGVQIVRVHDVAETRQFAAVSRALAVPPREES